LPASSSAPYRPSTPAKAERDRNDPHCSPEEYANSRLQSVAFSSSESRSQLLDRYSRLLPRGRGLSSPASSPSANSMQPVRSNRDLTQALPTWAAVPLPRRGAHIDGFPPEMLDDYYTAASIRIGSRVTSCACPGV
jgi:hypothetical protein